MIKKKLVAILMSALVVASTPIYAAYTYTPLSGTNVTYDTKITGTATSPLPAITASYSVGAVSGPTGGISSGTPSIANTVIAANTAIPSDGSYEATTTITLTGVTFVKPGEYIWPITSTAITGTPGLTFASTTKYLHVFIEDDTETTPQQLRQSTAFISSTSSAVVDSASDSGKTTYFEGSYGTKSLTVNAAAAGNMGDKTQTFNYTVNLTGCNAGTVIDGQTVSNAGAATITHEGLTHGESFTITGIPAGAGYTVTQGEVAGYTTQITVQKES